MNGNLMSTPKRRLLAAPAFLLFALTLIACPPPAQEVAEEVDAVEPSRGDEAALNSLIADYIVTLNSNDADGVAAVYAANAVRMAPDAPAVTGRESIRQLFARSFAASKRQVQMQVIETEFSGELAYVRGTFALSVTPNDGSPTTDRQGHWMRLMRREPDGAWLVAYSMFTFEP